MAEATSIRLPSGTVASLSPDPFVADSMILTLDGVPQSHIDLGDPRELFYDYVRRMGTAIDLAAPTGDPLTVLHLGAGALTLARYVASTRPGSRQLVVENERGLVPFVLDAAPLPGNSSITLMEDDALAALRSLAAPAGDWHERIDIVVCDVYAGLSTPPHLVTPDFFDAVRSLVTRDGTVLVNVADDADLAHTRSQISALEAAFPAITLIAPSALLDGRESGNAVLLAGSNPAIIERMPFLAAAGPHPVAWRPISRRS